MTPERWVRIKEIFDEVIEAPENERNRVLGIACAGDDELVSEMRKLLAEHASTEGFLDHPVLGSDTVLSPAPNFPALEPGQVLSQRFRIVRFIARGGMGEVYEAYDAELDEAVALKTIRSEIAADPRVVTQFRREVRQARKISSPYVCRVNDLFTHPLEEGRSLVYLTMQLLVGESLSERLVRRGKMDPEQALPLLEQMGEALEAAHRAGIIHRDFKSGNVMLVRREDASEQAVITDFGLALPAVATDPSTRDAFNAAGTPAYMAPEQLEDKTLTIATDIYSLGVVAYEMVTGQLPYGVQPPSKRLNSPPLPPRSVVPELDPRWDFAILRCLEHDPALRFSSATEVAESIAAPRVWLRVGRRQWVMAAVLIALVCLGVLLLALLGTRSPHPNSIAVLPFQMIGGTADSEYYADGFTEQVADILTKIRSLRVIQRESSFHFKTSHMTLSQVARQLKVAKIVTGSVQRSGGKLRIIALLINASDGKHIWSETYDGDEKDVFKLQDKIARAIAAALQVNLAGLQMSARTERAPNVKALDLYLFGLFLFNKRTDEGMLRALDYFNQAIATDPNYPAPYIGLADAYCVLSEHGLKDPLSVLPKAKQAVQTALTLDPEMADAHASWGQVASLYDRDFVAAERHFLQALELNPNLLIAHQWYSYLLTKLLRFDESLQHALRAQELDPFSSPANNNLAILYMYMHQYDKAIETDRRALEMDPHHPFAALRVANCLSLQGRHKEALDELETNAGKSRDHPLVERYFGEINARAGKREEAENVANDLISRKTAGRIPASYIAIVYAALGDKDQAFDWLERSYAEGDGFLSMIQAYPAYDSLRSDPRYLPLLERLGLRGSRAPGSSGTH